MAPSDSDDKNTMDRSEEVSSQERGRRQVVLSPPPMPRGHAALYRGVPGATARPLDASALDDLRRGLSYKLDTLAPDITLDSDAEYGGLARFHLVRSADYLLDAAVRQVGTSRVLDVDRLEFTASVPESVQEDVLDALIWAACSLNRHPNLLGTDIRVRNVGPGTERLWTSRGVDLGLRQVDQATLRPYFGRPPERLAAQFESMNLGNSSS